MTTLRLAFPAARIEEGTGTVYFKFLADLAYEEVRGAVGEIVASATYLPSVGEVRRLVIERRLALPSAAEAWEQAVGAGKRHALTQRALEAIGGSYSLRVTENLPTVRSQFERLYGSLRAEEVRVEGLLGLGLSTRQIAGERPRELSPPESEEPHTAGEEGARRAREMIERLNGEIEDVA